MANYKEVVLWIYYGNKTAVDENLNTYGGFHNPGSTTSDPHINHWYPKKNQFNHHHHPPTLSDKWCMLCI